MNTEFIAYDIFDQEQVNLIHQTCCQDVYSYLLLFEPIEKVAIIDSDVPFCFVAFRCKEEIGDFDPLISLS